MLTGILIGIFLTVGALWFGFAGQVRAEEGGGGFITDEGAESTVPWEITSGDELPPEGFIDAAEAPAALPTTVPGQTQVYFVPMDNDATATVIYLYNTSSSAHVVALRGFSYNGVLVYSLNINVPATGFLRLANDIIAPPRPAGRHRFQ